MRVSIEQQPNRRPAIGRPQRREDATALQLQCPHCGETRHESLTWIAMDQVRCMSCGFAFRAWFDRSD